MMPPRGMSILSWTAITGTPGVQARVGVLMVVAFAVIRAIVRLAEANPVIGFGLLIGIVCIICLGLADVEPL